MMTDRQAVLAVQTKMEALTTRQVASNLRQQVLAEFARRFGNDAYEVIP